MGKKGPIYLQAIRVESSSTVEGIFPQCFVELIPGEHARVHLRWLLAPVLATDRVPAHIGAKQWIPVLSTVKDLPAFDLE